MSISLKNENSQNLFNPWKVTGHPKLHLNYNFLLYTDFEKMNTNTCRMLEVN